MYFTEKYKDNFKYFPQVVFEVIYYITFKGHQDYNFQLTCNKNVVWLFPNIVGGKSNIANRGGKAVTKHKKDLDPISALF